MSLEFRITLSYSCAASSDEFSATERHKSSYSRSCSVSCSVSYLLQLSGIVRSPLSILDMSTPVLRAKSLQQLGIMARYRDALQAGNLAQLRL